MGKEKSRYKKRTAAEKKLRKQVKADLIAEGLIPPPKKPLNRKKFADEVLTEMEKGFYMAGIGIGMGLMLPIKGQNKITLEEIGALKVIKIALEYQKIDTDEKNDIDRFYKEVAREILEL